MSNILPFSYCITAFKYWQTSPCVPPLGPYQGSKTLELEESSDSSEDANLWKNGKHLQHDRDGGLRGLSFQSGQEPLHWTPLTPL